MGKTFYALRITPYVLWWENLGWTEEEGWPKMRRTAGLRIFSGGVSGGGPKPGLFQ
jgi:hypothetical protein